MKRKVFDLFLAQLFPLTASVLTVFATAVILGPSERGKVALILSTAGLIGAMGYISLQVGIVRADRLGDPSAVRRGFIIAFVIAISVCMLGVGIALLIPNLSVGVFDQQSLTMVACGGGLVIFNLVVLRTRQGLGGSRVYRDAWFIQSAAFLVLAIPLALAYRSSIAVILSWFMALTASTIFALAKPDKVKREGDVQHHVSNLEIFRTSISAHVGVAGQQLLHSADILILGVMTNAISVGIYSVAVPIAGLLWVFTEVLSLLAFDTGSKMSSVKERSVQRLRLTRLNFLVGLIGAVAIGLGSVMLLPVLLPQYAMAVPLILILLPGVLVQGYARIGLASIVTSGANRALILIGLSSALLCAFYIPFVHAGGVMGAAIASSAIYGLQTVVVFLVVRNVMKKLGTQEANAVNG